MIYNFIKHEVFGIQGSPEIPFEFYYDAWCIKKTFLTFSFVLFSFKTFTESKSHEHRRELAEHTHAVVH